MALRPPTSSYIQTPDPAAIRGSSSPVFPLLWLREEKRGKVHAGDAHHPGRTRRTAEMHCCDPVLSSASSGLTAFCGSSVMERCVASWRRGWRARSTDQGADTYGLLRVRAGPGKCVRRQAPWSNENRRRRSARCDIRKGWQFLARRLRTKGGFPKGPPIALKKTFLDRPKTIPAISLSGV